jgi:ribonuclease P protein subunit RPR2
MKKRIRKGKPRTWIKIAKERIKILFDLAKKEFKTNPERSKKYIQLARKIGMRYNVRLTKRQKRSFCKKCNQLLIPSKTSKVTINSKRKLVEIECLNCGSLYRYPYKIKKI